MKISNVLIAKILLIGLLFFSAAASACSCGSSSLEEKVVLSDNIFIVETTSIETIENANEKKFIGGQRRGYFKVLEELKGSSSGFEFIQSADKPVCCICQSQVKNKTKYIVFVNESGPIVYSACGFTKPVSNPEELSETIKTMIQPHKPSEIFTGIFVRDRRLFLNDDGSQSKILQLKRKDYFVEMSRISFEGVKLKSGAILAIELIDELSLSPEEATVVNERLLKSASNKITK